MSTRAVLRGKIHLVLRFCSSCQQQRPIREFDLGAAQLSRTCLGCADERLRTEDPRDRSQRTAQILTLEQRRRELYAALVAVDAQIVDVRASSLPHIQLPVLEKRRRELIAALVTTDAQIADLHARPTPSRIVLEDRVCDEADETAFDDAADLGQHMHDELA